VDNKKTAAEKRADTSLSNNKKGNHLCLEKARAKAQDVPSKTIGVCSNINR